MPHQLFNGSAWLEPVLSDTFWASAECQQEGWLCFLVVLDLRITWLFCLLALIAFPRRVCALLDALTDRITKHNSTITLSTNSPPPLPPPPQPDSISLRSRRVPRT